ncbi:hypothetical protein ACFPES_05170 [Paenibacillus sp. GCM10023248]|nr:hypothetical protein [Bacillus sp. 3255]MDD9266420.1 hypothetical protein [Paenibacillus sp. MAHUQ-63]
MILLSLVLFRQKVKPHWLAVSLAACAGAIVTRFDQWPILYISILGFLLMAVWKFRLIPAIVIAVSGYVVSIIVSTGVLLLCQWVSLTPYTELLANPQASVTVLTMILIAKCAVLIGMRKLRLGFTFLTHYTRIPLSKENAGFYLYIAVVIVGILHRHASPENVISALMPVQLLGMATVLFVYAMLSKEFRFQR